MACYGSTGNCSWWSKTGISVNKSNFIPLNVPYNFEDRFPRFKNTHSLNCWTLFIDHFQFSGSVPVAVQSRRETPSFSLGLPMERLKPKRRMSVGTKESYKNGNCSSFWIFLVVPLEDPFDIFWTSYDSYGDMEDRGNRQVKLKVHGSHVRRSQLKRGSCCRRCIGNDGE